MEKKRHNRDVARNIMAPEIFLTRHGLMRILLEIRCEVVEFLQWDEECT